MREGCRGGPQGRQECRCRYVYLLSVILFVDRARTDNTNRDVATRKYYLDLAKQYKVRARWVKPRVYPPFSNCLDRCFFFTGSMDLAWHNNLYRAYIKPASDSQVRCPRHAEESYLRSCLASKGCTALSGLHRFSRQLRRAPGQRRVFGCDQG